MPARLLVRAVSTSPVYTESSALIRPSSCTIGSSVSPLDARVTATDGVGDRLLVALPDVARFGAGDERGGRGGVGDRQLRVELSGGERQRLGVVENRGQRLLAVVDGRRCGKRAGDDQRGQDDADGENAARGGPQEPPARVRRCCRRP